MRRPDRRPPLPANDTQADGAQYTLTHMHFPLFLRQQPIFCNSAPHAALIPSNTHKRLKLKVQLRAFYCFYGIPIIGQEFSSSCFPHSASSESGVTGFRESIRTENVF